MAGEMSETAYQREYLKLFLVKNLEDDFAQGVTFILKNIPARSVNQTQWGTMLKLFTNQAPYSIQALNRESVMFTLGYMDSKIHQASFETFQAAFKKIRWEITNREELEPLIEILSVDQVRSLVALFSDCLRVLRKRLLFPSEREVAQNVRKRSSSTDPTSRWFTTIPKHHWQYPEQMMAC